MTQKVAQIPNAEMGINGDNAVAANANAVVNVVTSIALADLVYP